VESTAAPIHESASPYSTTARESSRQPSCVRQYCSQAFQNALKGYEMKSSMSSGKGVCWAKAPTESLWGRLKVGFATRREAMDVVMD